VLATAGTCAIDLLAWIKPKADWVQVPATICVMSGARNTPATISEPFQEFKRQDLEGGVDAGSTSQTLFNNLVFFQRQVLKSLPSLEEPKRRKVAEALQAELKEITVPQATVGYIALSKELRRLLDPEQAVAPEQSKREKKVQLKVKNVEKMV